MGRVVVLALLLAGCSEYGIGDDAIPKPEVEDTAVPEGILSLEVLPAILDFGVVPVGGLAEGTATVTNVGDEIVHVAEIALIVRDDAFAMIAPAVDVLDPGDAVTLELSFSPLERGEFLGNAYVDSDAVDPSDDRVELRGRTADPGIWIDPTFTDLGSIAVGAEETVYLTVGNDGAGPVSIHETDWWSTSPELSITDAGPLASLPLTLPGGETVVVEVTYAPDDTMGDEGTFRVFSDDPASPEISAQLGGEGEGEAGLWLRPAHHDFGVLEVGIEGRVELVPRAGGDLRIFLRLDHRAPAPDPTRKP